MERYDDLQPDGISRKHRTAICKVDSGCQGRGIFIARSEKDIKPGQDNVCMHLTNYSISKNGVNSAREEDAGGKK